MKPIIAMHHFDFTLSPAQVADIAAVAPRFDIVRGPFDALSAEQLERVQVVYGNPPLSLVPSMGDLRLLQLQSAGADAFCAPDLFARADVRLCNGRGTFGAPIAEHVLASFLCMNRGLHLYRDRMKDALWQPIMPPMDMQGATVAIVGLGDIGLHLAKLCKAFDCHILGVRRTAGAPPAHVDELFTTEALAQALPRADFIALCLPNTPQTQGLITREILFSLKPHALLVNVGRGTVLDQQALHDALIAKALGGAVLDVATPEPLPAESPFWRMENVLITSHGSGRSPTNAPRSLAIFLDNLHRWLQGIPPINSVQIQLRY